MIKIAHVREVTDLKIPKEVVNIVKDSVIALDNEYGKCRDVDAGDGGYVLVIEAREELEKLKDIYIDVKTTIAEYTDEILCDDGRKFTSTLVLLNDDFCVVVIMPIEFLTDTNWILN